MTEKGGNRTEGEILIKFDSSSPAWADTVYERFIQWLQGNVDKREKLRCDFLFSLLDLSLITPFTEARQERRSGKQRNECPKLQTLQKLV
jgi:hypothetical protein